MGNTLQYTKVFFRTIILLAALEKFLRADSSLRDGESGCKLTDMDTRLSIAAQHIETVRQKLSEDLEDLCPKTSCDVRPIDCSECAKIPFVKKPDDWSEYGKTEHSANPFDCSDLYQEGFDLDGIYEIWPYGYTPKGSLHVYCDMTTDGGGWTVIQRRGDFNNSYDYFDEDWDTYKLGFGDPLQDFWIGNSNIFIMTNQRTYQLKIDLRDWDGNYSHALYDKFWVDHEFHNYVLHVGTYSGTAGDSLRLHNGKYFTTKDLDNDEEPDFNCAARWKGGWWYRKCYSSNLNGQYRNGTHVQSDGGVHWHGFKGFEYSLKDTVMKIRPSDFEARIAINNTIQ